MKNQKLKRKNKRKNPYRQSTPQEFETDKWYILELKYDNKDPSPKDLIILQFSHYDEEIPIFKENVRILYPKNILPLDQILNKYKKYDDYEIHGPFENFELISSISQLELKRELLYMKQQELKLKKKR